MLNGAALGIPQGYHGNYTVIIVSSLDHRSPDVQADRGLLGRLGPDAAGGPMVSSQRVPCRPVGRRRPTSLSRLSRAPGYGTRTGRRSPAVMENGVGPLPQNVAKRSRWSRRAGDRIYREHPSPLAGILQALGPPSARNQGLTPVATDDLTATTPRCSRLAISRDGRLWIGGPCFAMTAHPAPHPGGLRCSSVTGLRSSGLKWSFAGRRSCRSAGR